MAKYRAKVKLLIAHESRLVEASEEFDTTFPEGMKLEPNIELVEDEDAKGKKAPKAKDA